MTIARDAKYTPVLLLSLEKRTYSDYYEVLTGLVRFYDSETGELRSLWSDEIADVQFRAQADTRERDKGFYGATFSVHSNSVGLGLWEAEKIVKVLRKLEQGLKRIDERDGGWQSIGQYILRAMRVLGIERLGLYPPKGASEWMSGEKIRYYSGGSIQSQVDMFLFDWQAQQGRFAEAVA